MRKYLIIVCLLILSVFSFGGYGEAYSVTHYSSWTSNVLPKGKLTVNRTNTVYYAGYSNSYVSIYSSNGNSALSLVTSINEGGFDGFAVTAKGYVIDGSNRHWSIMNYKYQADPTISILYRYDGSTLSRAKYDDATTYKALGIDPSDGSAWISSSGNWNGIYRWNGSSWVSQPSPGWDVESFGVDYSNGFWAGGSAGQTALWNGSSWTSKGTISGSPKVVKLLVNPATRAICAITSAGLYQYDGATWVYVASLESSDNASITVDGKPFDDRDKTKPIDYSLHGPMIDSVLLSDGSIYAVNTCYFDGITYVTPTKYSYSLSSFSMTPSSNGMTGQLKLNGTFDGRAVGYANLQYSTNGSSFSDLRVMSNGDAGSLTPTSNNYWFRIRWDHRTHPLNSWTTNYTNSYGAVPAITSAPGVSSSTGIKTWDASRGRSWAVLSWGGLSGASGYKLQFFDGNTYRLKDIGNVTSWDTRTKLVFPFVANLPENNSVGTDPFRWDATGLDFEDTAVRLYRSTVGTSYDTVTGYYFKVTAYNSWMETTESLVYVILPNATDSTGPSGTISVTVPNGATAPATVTLSLSSVVDNSGGSGLYQMRFSNDNAAYSAWENYAVSKSWTTSSGEGEKTVYAQVKDNVGNTTTLTASFWLGATLTQINNEAMAAKQNAEAARQASVDAKTSAEAAKTSAQTAATNSGIAATNSQTAADRSYYTGKYGGNTESVADLSGYMRNTQLPAIDTKVDSIKTDVVNLNTIATNISNTLSADTTSPTVSVKTLSGAVATSGGTINIIVTASDNRSVALTYSVNGGAYQALPGDGIISVPVSNSGPNAITIRIKDEAGNAGIATIVIRKL